MVQGQVDKKNYLLYDSSSNKAIFKNVLREEVKATNVWKEQNSVLRDVGTWLNSNCLTLNQRNTQSSFYPAGQYGISVYEANGGTPGSWGLGLHGQRLLVFDSESGKYTVDHSGGEQMRENGKEVTNFFTIISIGDWNKWLKLLAHWMKELQTIAAPTVASTTAQSKAMTIMPHTSVLPVILIYWTIISIPGWVLYSNRRCCSEAPESVIWFSMSLLAGCLSISSYSTVDS